MDISAETFHSCLKDFCVVESQLGEFVIWKPNGLLGIIASENLMGPNQSIPGNGDCALAWVAVYIREDTRPALSGCASITLLSGSELWVAQKLRGKIFFKLFWILPGGELSLRKISSEV